MADGHAESATPVFRFQSVERTCEIAMPLFLHSADCFLADGRVDDALLLAADIC
jgi:hypothetical protein